MFNIEKILSVITIVFCIVAITVMLFGLRAEIVIAAVSGIIALIALRANIREGKATRKHNRLSVKPFLSIESSGTVTGNKVCNTATLVNDGTGPAIIKKFQLLLDGTDISQHNAEIHTNFLLESKKICSGVKVGHLAPDSIVNARDKKLMWEFDHDLNSEYIETIIKLKIQIEYQSIYEDETFYYPLKKQK